MTSSNGTRQRAQMEFGEQKLEDAELAGLLQKRDEAREKRVAPNKLYKGLNDQVKAKIEQKELANGSYRVGAYIIKISESQGREVSFERASSRRITITPAKT